MEKPHWKVRSSSLAIDSPYLRIRRDEVELPSGAIIPEYFVRESRGFTMVFAVTERREVVMIHEYRYGIDAVLLECPAGTIDAGEDPLACAQRELREETGYEAPRWERLFAVPSEPARSNAVMHAFLAFDARRSGTIEHDLSEHIETVLVPLASLDRRTIPGSEPMSLATVAITSAALERLGTLGLRHPM